MALTPRKTLSGASFPIQTSVTAGAACSVGDLLQYQTDGKWDPEGNATALGNGGQLAVALTAASADGDTIAVCYVTPDVVFAATADHNAIADMTNEPPYTVVGTSGSAGINDTRATAAEQVVAYYHSDAADETALLYVVLSPGSVEAIP